MNVATSYVSQMLREFGQRGTWPPDLELKLGDVGVMKGNVFKPLRHLVDWKKRHPKLSYKAITPGVVGDRLYTSRSGVDRQFAISATASSVQPISGAAQVKVRMSRKGAVVFEALDGKLHRISDQGALGEQLIALYNENDWNLSYYVVVEVLVAANVAVIVSESKDAEVNFLANGKGLDVATPLADATAEYRVISQKGTAAQHILRGRVTPLYNVARVRPSFLGDPTYVAYGARIKADEALTPSELRNRGEVDLSFQMETGIVP